VSSGGLLGPILDRLSRDEPTEQTLVPQLSTAHLLRKVAPRKTERARLVQEIERRFILHYVMPDNYDVTH
jgi:hypothetical protein